MKYWFLIIFLLGCTPAPKSTGETQPVLDRHPARFYSLASQYTVKVIEFHPKGDPGTLCVITYTASGQSLFCIP